MKPWASLYLLLICLSPFVRAENDATLMNKGFEVLYSQALDKYNSCREAGADNCSFSEVNAFLELMDLKFPTIQKAASYPRSASQAGYAAKVANLLTIADDGTVTHVEVLACRSGKGDTDLQLGWKRDGRNCKQFSTNAKRALGDWQFPVLPTSLQGEPRTQLWQVVFALRDANSYDINTQNSDLSRSHIRKIQKFTEKKDWAGLEKFALKNIDKNTIFQYYAADAAWMQGRQSEATEGYAKFVEAGGKSYWHFGAKSAAITIPHFFNSGDDQKVVSLGNASLLEQYFYKGNVVAKAAITEALLMYANALMFIEEPQIGEALVTFKRMKKHGRRYGGVTREQMKLLNEQIKNLESQRIEIGRSSSKSG